jgi:hypothetical protein
MVFQISSPIRTIFDCKKPTHSTNDIMIFEILQIKLIQIVLTLTPELI